MAIFEQDRMEKKVNKIKQSKAIEFSHAIELDACVECVWSTAMAKWNHGGKREYKKHFWNTNAAKIKKEKKTQYLCARFSWSSAPDVNVNRKNEKNEPMLRVAITAHIEWYFTCHGVSSNVNQQYIFSFPLCVCEFLLLRFTYIFSVCICLFRAFRGWETWHVRTHTTPFRFTFIQAKSSHTYRNTRTMRFTLACNAENRIVNAHDARILRNGNEQQLPMASRQPFYYYMHAANFFLSSCFWLEFNFSPSNQFAAKRTPQLWRKMENSHFSPLF